MKFIEFFFTVLAITFPFGQLARIPLSFFNLSEVRIYLIDLLIFLLFLSWLAWHVIKRERFVFPKLAKYLLFFLGTLVLSQLANLRNFRVNEISVGWLYLLRYGAYSLIYWVIYDLKGRRLKINNRLILNCFIGWGVVLSLLGMGQYLLIPDTRFLYSLGWDLHYFRVVGPFLDPNFMGILLALGILCWLSYLIGRVKEVGDVRNNFWQLSLLIFMGVPFLLTYSRSSYLALISGVIVLLYLSKKFKYFLFFIFSFLIFILLLPRPGGEGVKLERVTSAFQRIESWQTAIKVWQKHPLFGVGFNNYRYALRDMGYLGDNWKESHAGAGVENSYLFVLATAGIIGLIGLIGLIGESVKEAMKAEESTKYLVLPSFCAIFVHCLFINSFFYPWVMIWFWFLLGFTESKTG